MATKPTAKKTAPASSKAAAKRAAPAKKAAAPETITLKAVFEQIAEAQELPRKQAQALMSAMITSVTDHLKKGNRIRMSGLGILEVKNREARTGRNPATGEAIQIAASEGAERGRLATTGPSRDPSCRARPRARRLRRMAACW